MGKSPETYGECVFPGSTAEQPPPAPLAMMRSLLMLLSLTYGASLHTVALPRVASHASRSASSAIEMRRVCDISGKSANNANRVTFSNEHNAYRQYPNLQRKRFFSEKLNRIVKLKVATSTMRTIRKLGLDETAEKYGVDLSKF